MKTRSFVFLLLTCLLLVMTGCSDKKAEEVIKDTIGELVEETNEEIQKDKLEGQKFSDDDDSVKIMSSKWPKDIPKDYVEFEYGRHVQTVYHEEEDDWSILYTATTDEIQEYEEDLKDNGWVNDEDYSDTPSVLSYDLGDSNTSIVIGEAEDSIHIVTLYLDPDQYLAKEDNSFLEDKVEEGFSFESEDVSHSFGAEIPDDYPHDFCPIYQPSTVELVMESADEESTGYVISLGTNDDFEQVKDFYLSLDPQYKSDLGMMVSYSFYSEDEKSNATVTLITSEEGENEEFETYMNISVTIVK